METLAEVLRGVRGFYINNDRNYSYLGVRGFGRSGDYNTRVLLLLNGHRVNDNVYDQASIGSELGLDIETIERVEIIRGPASSLYGTSAFFAVINIITKTGEALNGSYAEAALGSLGSRTIRAANGRRLSNGLEYVVSAAFNRSDGVAQLYFPEWAARGRGDGIAHDLDAEQFSSAYGQLRFGPLSFTAAAGYRRKEIPTGSFGMMFNAQDPAASTDDERAIVTADFDRHVGESRVGLSASLNRYHYDGIYPYEPGPDGIPVVYTDGVEGKRLTVNGRLTRHLPARQTLTAGLEFVGNVQQDQWLTTTDEAEDWRTEASSRQAAAFVQDEIAVLHWLRLSGGLRYDTYGHFSRVTPRGAVIVGSAEQQVVKYLYGRAFRAPNAYELGYWPETSNLLRPEDIGTHEIVWERYTGDWLRTSAAAYWYDATELITFTTIDPDLTIYAFENEGRTTARGFEAEAEVRLRSVNAFASYAAQRSRAASGEPLPNSPDHTLTVRGSVGNTARARFASIEMLAASGRRTLAGRQLPASALFNATASLPLGRALSLRAVAANLLDRRYHYPASEEHLMDVIEQNGRTLRLEIRWKVGRK